MLKAYKYKIYPNKEQECLIQKTFGCCRFVYNQALAYRKDLYEKENKSMSRLDCNYYVRNVLKQKYEWLKEVDKFALENSVFDMDKAYQNFLNKQAGFPKFKSKHKGKKSYKTNITVTNIQVSGNAVKLPKLKWVKAKIHRLIDGKIKSATISQTPTGKYYVSILTETEYIQALHKSNNKVGIDLGIKDLVITSNGEKFDNLKLINKYEDKLAKEQRKLAHKHKGSKNYKKQRIRASKIHEKIVNARKDYLHKISHKLISENQVIVSEDLSVRNMVKNHNLAKAISDCGWYELTRQLQYKSEWNSRTYIKVGRFVPSSQVCHVCGYKNVETKDLSVRKWICPQCSTQHDRDVNAAMNILHEGLKQIV